MGSREASGIKQDSWQSLLLLSLLKIRMVTEKVTRVCEGSKDSARVSFTGPAAECSSRVEGTLDSIRLYVGTTTTLKNA